MATPANPTQQPAQPAQPAHPTQGAQSAQPTQAVKKEPKEAKPKTPKPKKEGVVARPRLPKYDENHVITVLKENAKARGAADRFKRYHTGMTVKQYVDKIREDFDRTEGQTFADMRWDEDHKFIHIGPTVVPVPVAAPAAGAPAPTAA
jgi:hypothetical protein